MTFSRGRSTAYAYDALYVTAVTDAKGQVYRFAPNALGWVEAATDPRGNVTRRAYDAGGNQTSTTDRRGTVVTFAYDALNVLTARTAGGRTATYRTDPLDRFNAAANDVSVDTVFFDVAGGRRSRLVFPSMTGGRDYAYDAVGRIKSYTYFSMSGGATCAPVNEGTVATGYNCAAASKVDQAATAFAYDLVGNRTSNSAVIALGNRLNSYAQLNFTYDSAGNALTKVGTRAGQYFDEAFGWNDLGQLDWARVAGRGTMSYYYDAWGRRVMDARPSGRSHYVYAGNDLLAQTDSAGNPQTEYLTAPGGLDRPLGMRRGGTAGRMYYYQYDGAGNVAGLVDDAGALTSQYYYDPFGNLESGSASAVYDNIGWKGRETDADAALVQNRARWYDADLGRFVSEDPIGLAGGINP